jgi:biotin carboxyl carrier protein
MKYTAMVDGQKIEINFERTGSKSIEARIGTKTYQLEASAVEPGVYWFNFNNRSIEVHVCQSGDGYSVAVSGHHIPVEILDARTALKKAAQHGHDGLIEIRAPMPGKIVKVLISEGGEVHPNQGILVMEAMKMQNEIKSPKKGVVRKLGVSEGVAVNAGDLLASVE